MLKITFIKECEKYNNNNNNNKINNNNNNNNNKAMCHNETGNSSSLNMLNINR